VGVRFGEFAVDPGARQLLKRGVPVHLGPKAFALLELLLAHRPQALSKAQIHDSIWPRTFVAESNLTTLVAELRSALGDPPRSPRLIRTVYGFGYAFCGEAKAAGAGGARLRLFIEDREIALHEGENVLGRGDDAVALIESALASRRHARIVVSGEHAVLEDLASKNGTFLRNQRIRAPADLADGDEIRIGRSVMTFRVLRRLESTQTEAR
jgi:DNA-binding winged helix-turn-helix (wHTH) protein